MRRVSMILRTMSSTWRPFGGGGRFLFTSQVLHLHPFYFCLGFFFEAIGMEIIRQLKSLHHGYEPAWKLQSAPVMTINVYKGLTGCTDSSKLLETYNYPTQSCQFFDSDDGGTSSYFYCDSNEVLITNYDSPDCSGDSSITTFVCGQCHDTIDDDSFGPYEYVYNCVSGSVSPSLRPTTHQPMTQPPSLVPSTLMPTDSPLTETPTAPPVTESPTMAPTEPCPFDTYTSRRLSGDTFDFNVFAMNVSVIFTMDNGTNVYNYLNSTFSAEDESNPWLAMDSDILSNLNGNSELTRRLQEDGETACDKWGRICTNTMFLQAAVLATVGGFLIPPGIVVGVVGGVVLLGSSWGVAFSCAGRVMCRVSRLYDKATNWERRLLDSTNNTIEVLQEPMEFVFTFEYAIVTVLDEFSAQAQFNETFTLPENSTNLMDLFPTFAASLTSPSGVLPLTMNMTAPVLVASVPGSQMPSLLPTPEPSTLPSGAVLVVTTARGGSESSFPLGGIIGIAVGGGVLLIALLVLLYKFCSAQPSKNTSTLASGPHVAQSYTVVDQKPIDVAL